MPFTQRDPEIGACELLPPASDYAIEAHVVFQGIGPRHVVVVCIAEANDEASGLIHLSGNRLEPRRDLDVGRVHRCINCKRKPVVGAVGIQLRKRNATVSRGVFGYFPTAVLALAGQRALEDLRQRADLLSGKSYGLRRTRCWHRQYGGGHREQRNKL